MIPATAIAFVIGYFVNTLSSLLEVFYYITWAGKPSYRLLDGKDIWKVRFYEHTNIRKMLKEESLNPSPTNDELFSIEMRYATPEVNSRVADFNAIYAFSRVILATIMIVSILMIITYYDSYFVYFITLTLIVISWLRCKQRGYYFAREVLRTYYTCKKVVR